MRVGTGRTVLSPAEGVELAGYGYYLERRWDRVRDNLYATATVFDDGKRAVAICSLDILYADAEFTSHVREGVASMTDIAPDDVMVACTHTHNAPTCGHIEGAGVVDPVYRSHAAALAAAAVVTAWKERREAVLQIGHTEFPGFSFNRTREDGPTDNRVTVLRADAENGEPIAILLNFSAHPTLMANLGRANVSRDYPGQVVDALESVFRPAKAAFLQGAAGDTNFKRIFEVPEMYRQPGRALVGASIDALAHATPMTEPTVAAASGRVVLPTRRWTKEEIDADHNEGTERLKTGSIVGWRDHLGRVMVTRPDHLVEERYRGEIHRAVNALARFAVAWTERVRPDLDTRDETLETEIQAMRIGDAYVMANPAELFSSFALSLRTRWTEEELMVVGYANDRIGYVPDAQDIAAKNYASVQSPKFFNQFPFTEKTGEVLVGAMLELLGDVKGK